ncbi:MAG: hypothetical protein ACOC6A_01775 [Chloroflexota bacterium]
MIALLMPILREGVAHPGLQALWGLGKTGTAVTIFLIVLVGLAAAWLINGTRRRD